MKKMETIPNGSMKENRNMAQRITGPHRGNKFKEKDGSPQLNDVTLVFEKDSRNEQENKGLSFQSHFNN